MARILWCSTVALVLAFSSPAMGSPDTQVAPVDAPAEVKAFDTMVPVTPVTSAPPETPASPLTLPLEPQNPELPSAAGVSPVGLSPDPISVWWLEIGQLVLAAALMTLIWVVRKFWTTLPKEALPWVSAVLGVASTALLSLMDGTPFATKDAVSMLLMGTLTGFAGAGIWSGAGKYVLPTNKK